MKEPKNIAAIGIAFVVWIGLPALATAGPNDFTFVATQDLPNNSQATTQSAAQGVFNDSDITDSFRADSTGSFSAPGIGAFTVTEDPLTNSGPTYTVTWALDAGIVLEGVYFKGGSQGGNFYGAGELNSGTGDGHTPLTGNSGMFADLSHLDFFTEPASVPEGGTTSLILLGCTLFGLGAMRRFVKRWAGE
jgi:hypothetical protein